MGQKINPSIFRLGINQSWKTAYYEKILKELSLYIHKDNNLLQFIERYLNNLGILIHDYNCYFNNSSFTIYISYFVVPSYQLINKDLIKEKLVILDKQSKKKKSITNDLKFQKEISLLNDVNFLKSLIDSKSEFYRIKPFLKSKHMGTFNKESVFSPNLFLSKLNQIINLFLSKNKKILFCFNCLNKDLSYLKHLSQKQLKVLKRFNRLPIFKESLELLIFIVGTQKTSKLFAMFLSKQFQKIKRQNFFLKFIRQVFTVLIKSPFSKYRGIKIIISGRLNGVPRAKHKIITIGDVPVTSIITKLDYAQTFCHNSNGSYGIKIWMSPK